MKRVESAFSLAGVLVLHHVIFSCSGWSSLKTGKKFANDKDNRLLLSELNITKNGVVCQLLRPRENASWKRVSRERLKCLEKPFVPFPFWVMRRWVFSILFGRNVPCPAKSRIGGVKGHNRNETSSSGSLALCAGSFNHREEKIDIQMGLWYSSFHQ